MPFSSLKGYRHFSSGNKKNSAIDVSFWWCFLEACNQQIFWLCKGRKRWYYPAEYACMRPQITPTQYLVCLLVDLLRSFFVPTVVDQLSNSWQPLYTSLLPAGDLCTACLRLLGNTDMASYRSTVPVLGLSTCLEVHTIWQRRCAICLWSVSQDRSTCTWVCMDAGSCHPEVQQAKVIVSL